MSHYRLNINGKDIPTTAKFPVSINKSVANIREPEHKNSGYTKTITLPGSPELNKEFEFIFQVNVETNSFNPNVKTPASYYVNEVRVFKGDLQLLAVNKSFNGLQEQVEYECSIVGENGNLFLDIAGLYLTDIDMSDLDHEFTYASGLFNPTLGEGYCYPYIDYGVNPLGGRVGRYWTFEHLKPAIFEREYVRRIFDDAGYTWEASGFLDSDYYKHIIIPDVNPGALQFDGTTVANNQFLAIISSTDNNNIPLTYSTTWSASNFAEVMPFDDDSSIVDGVQYFDPGGVYDTTTFIFEPSINGSFQISASSFISISGTPPAGTTSVSADFVLTTKIWKSTNGGGSWTVVANGTYSVNNETSFPHNYQVEAVVPPTLIIQPAIFRVEVGVSNIGITYFSGVIPITSGTASMDFNYTGTFGAVLATANLPSGETVEMNNTIPQNVTQLEFLTSIIKLENLYFEPDISSPRKYIIEPREDFIQETDPKDWTDKLDRSKPITINPMGELDVKRYIFTYKSDKDHYNADYEAKFKEVYGTETVDVDSDFVRGEKKIEVVFSATPTASATDVSPPIDVVAARLFKSNGDLSEVEPMKCNIRRLYWGGMIDCASHYLIPDGYENPAIAGSYTGSTPISVSQYPFAGHVDHPMEPTVDLCWDNPLNLYWIFPQQTYTNNSRYGARWSKFISEITDRDSKIVTAYFYLTELDFYEFSFRKKVFFDGTYYFVNEIKDYDPQEEKSIPVELLKLQTGPTFTPMSITLQDQLGGGGMNNARTGPNMNMRGNYGVGKSFGYNNINNDPNALVIGNNNFIDG